MKIVAISDTHFQHRFLKLPEGDLLIHAGDISKEEGETEGQVNTFLLWFARQPYQYKIFIAGNHDYFLEEAKEKDIKSLLPPGVIYLNDSGVIIEGIHIWGSPVTPTFYDMAFNRDRGTKISKHWKMIPKDTDILITHGPAYGILDTNCGGLKAGCNSLKKMICSIKPKLHICGHIHEGYGQVTIDGTTYINASVLNEKDEMSNQPITYLYQQ